MTELNNVTVHSMLSKSYSQYFGFTESEVDDVCQMLTRSRQARQALACRDREGVKSRGTIHCALKKSKEFQGDFACYKKRLMIELDGCQHQEEKNVRKNQVEKII